MIYRHEIKKESLEGFIEVELFNYKERMEALKAMNFKVEKGEVNVNSDQIDTLSRMVAMVRSRVKQVNLIIVGTKDKFVVFDDLEYYDVYNELINELGGLLFNGIKVSSFLKKS
jgi:hypothetical protein